MENDEEMEKKFHFGFIVILSVFIYLLYLELNPKITGIWLRKGDDNKFKITLSGLKDFIMYPFKQKKMWLPNLWDMNFFVSIPIISGSIYFMKEYFNR